MGIKDILGGLLPERKKELQTSWKEADEFFEENKASDIESAEQRKQEFLNRTEDLLEDLEEGLKEFDNYDDSRDLQIVEDVAQNFYRTRKRMIEEFDGSEGLEDHLEDLEDFLEEFNDVTRKEGEVMKHIRQNSGELSEALEKLMSHREDIENFIDTEYQVLIQKEMVSEYIEEIENLKEGLEEAEEELEGRDTRDIKKDIESIEQKLDEIEGSGEWNEMKSLEREREELEKKKKEKRAEIKSQISEMDRGLKKLTYNIENEGLEFEGKRGILEKLENRSVDSLDNVRPEIDQALELVEDEDLLEGRDLEKFREGVEGLHNFQNMMEEIDKLEQEIDDVDERLSGFDLEEERQELQDRKDKLERDLREKKEEVRDLEEERDELELKLQRKILELEHFMDSLMYHDVEIKEVKEEWKK